MIWSAFILGLSGSLHCVGMCGPFAFLLNSGKKEHPIINSVLYNVGRVSTYVVFGLFFGLLGLLFNLSGIQEYVSIFSGVVFLLLGAVQIYSGKNLTENAYLYRFSSSLKAKLGTQLKSDSFFSGYFLGVLNGLLPCGMVYMALIGSLGMASFAGSGLYMLFFGLGTIPLMFLAAYGTHFFSPKWKQIYSEVGSLCNIDFRGVVSVKRIGLCSVKFTFSTSYSAKRYSYL